MDWPHIAFFYVRTSRIMFWRMCRDGWASGQHTHTHHTHTHTHTTHNTQHTTHNTQHTHTADQLDYKTFITPAMRWCSAWNRGDPSVSLIYNTHIALGQLRLSTHHHQFSLPHMVKTTQPLKRHQASFIKPHGLLSLVKNLFVGHVPIYESSKTAKKRRAYSV